MNSEYAQTVIHKNDNCKIPPLILTNRPNEIEESSDNRYGLPNYEGYYDAQGFPHTTYKYYKGLKNYYLFENKGSPIYVFDNHVHALFAWQEAKEAGLLKDKVALIRFDAHLDCEPCRSFEILSRKNIKEGIVKDVLNIKNFTEPALRANLVSKIYYCSGLQNTDIAQIIQARSKEDSYNPEFEVIKEYTNQNRLKDVSRETLRSLKFLPKLINNLRKENYDIILDIDFDIFTRENSKKLLEILPIIVKESQMTTCATSPAYSEQKKTIKILKRFLEKALRQQTKIC